MTLSLRPYQHTLREDIRAAFAAGHRQVLAVSPTGSGKTVTFVDMATRAIAAGRRVCIIMHRQELIQQTSRALGDFPHGIIQADHPPVRHHPLQVASVQTLVNRTALYAFDFLIVDEAHHTTARTYMKILEAYPFAHVLGVTATPCRTDGRGLRDAGFTALVQGPTVRWLTNAGYLSPARVYAPGGLDVSGVKRGTEFNRTELAEVTDRPVITGNAIDHYRRYADRQPAIAFCVSVAHAEHVALGFREAGYSAAAIDGKKTDSERARLIGALASGALHVLTSCDLISEGVDVPVVSAGIMLRPTQSRGLWMQQMGRCLRPAQGKTHAVILDHAGNSRRLGCLPDTEHVLSLDAPPAPRKADADPDAVTVRVCDRCLASHVARPTCPYCGYEYPLQSRTVDEVAGELELLDAAYEAAGRKAEEWQCRTLEDYQKLGAARGNKPGWAWHRWTNSRAYKAQVKETA
jgi:superfamily II DNA or RNA helicase